MPSTNLDPRNWVYIHCNYCGWLGVISRFTETYEHEDQIICVANCMKGNTWFRNLSNPMHEISFMNKEQYDYQKQFY